MTQRTQLILTVVLFFTVILLTNAARGGDDDDDDDRVLSLAGEWHFRMNGPAPGATQEALPAELIFDDTIELPGTTETRRKGNVQPTGLSGQLTRAWRFDGPAWYQRDVIVPDAWRGKRVTLLLERTKYAQVWLDDTPVGTSSILCTPHEYVLGQLEPGRRRITIVVDNTRKPVPGENHQTSDNTQGNWNGILGRIELRATDHVWLDDVQVYPDVRRKAIEVKGSLRNASGVPGAGTIMLTAGRATRQMTVSWDDEDGSFASELELGDDAASWDEFHPNLHELHVELRGQGIRDRRTIRFGLREFKTKGTQFTINGRTTFLRGKHDACVFPLTGHPPLDVEGWLAYFRTCKRWGINHVRFHSWTPPHAAFEAADQLGIYLQTELPFWGDFTEEIKAALRPEAQRILRCYGNHPSFVMLTLGNENRHSREIMGALVRELRAIDPDRRLYAQGSNNFLWDPLLPAGDDFLVTAHAKRSPDAPKRTVRGGHNTSDGSDGHVQTGPANTMTDYAAAIEGIPAPVVGHEVGQYTVYPNFSEIPKYTGVMRPDNLAHFRKRIESAGMADQADEFFRASGALAALCYREELEAALRTPGFGGFQILDLQDFPGQGTALVGMLDAFMDSKGIIEPERWRQFCAPIVLLARFDTYTWTNDQTFAARVQVAHYGEADLPAARVSWKLRGEDGRAFASGALPATDVRQGGVRTVGDISAELSHAPSPATLTLELAIDGSDVETSYDLWIYPPRISVEVPPGVTLARSFDANARDALGRGGRVLLVADASRPLARTVGGLFATDFWCWPMFHNKPGTMGLLCDPGHPALAEFLTEFHSNWQWFHLANEAQPLILDDLNLPRGYRPIVQVIDNLERVHRLGLIFEFRVGPGRLLVCATDLVAMQDKPEARQLLGSLLKYAASQRFDPRTEVSIEHLRELLLTTIPMRGRASASSESAGWPPHKAHHAIDGNEHTFWLSGDAPVEPWLRIDFDEPRDLIAAEVLWNDDNAAVAYLIEVSRDGSTWRETCDPSRGTTGAARHRIELTDADRVRAIRFRVTAAPDGARPGIREIRFLNEDGTSP